MANRLVDNVYIIDTGSANTALPWLQGSRIQSIKAWFSSTAGVVSFSGADTTNVILTLVPYNPVSLTGMTVEANLEGVSFPTMKVPVLTAGTAWIYFF